MHITTILTAPPLIEGGAPHDHYTVTCIEGQWFFVDHGNGTLPAVYECSGEAEALSRFDEAEAGRHRPGCRCDDCFDPGADRRKHVPARSREWQ